MENLISTDGYCPRCTAEITYDKVMGEYRCNECEWSGHKQPIKKKKKAKTLQLRAIKEWVNSLTEEELEKELFYNSEEYSVSGVVHKIERAKGDLYCTGEDDPSPLYTKKELKEQGMENDEIEEFDIEIPKNSYYLKF